jgi:hypothetical protein
VTESYQATQGDIDRFYKYVEKLPNGCHFWSGGRSRGKGNKKWYGSFKLNGKTIRAHVFACHVVGKKPPLKPGEERDHTCKFSLCVNDKHIEVVTKEVNNERRWAGKRKSEQQETINANEAD